MGAHLIGVESSNEAGPVSAVHRVNSLSAFPSHAEPDAMAVGAANGVTGRSAEIANLESANTFPLKW
jgi:hypothetical protein